MNGDGQHLFGGLVAEQKYNRIIEEWLLNWWQNSKNCCLCSTLLHYSCTIHFFLIPIFVSVNLVNSIGRSGWVSLFEGEKKEIFFFPVQYRCYYHHYHRRSLRTGIHLFFLCFQNCSLSSTGIALSLKRTLSYTSLKADESYVVSFFLLLRSSTRKRRQTFSCVVVVTTANIIIKISTARQSMDDVWYTFYDGIGARSLFLMLVTIYTRSAALFHSFVRSFIHSCIVIIVPLPLQ